MSPRQIQLAAMSVILPYMWRGMPHGLFKFREHMWFLLQKRHGAQGEREEGGISDQWHCGKGKGLTVMQLGLSLCHSPWSLEHVSLSL